MSEMDEFKVTFFIECAELLADTEDRLLKLNEGVYEQDQLNAIFRCAHSIKGGAGAFGLDTIMQFTHTMEALLDLMREGKLLPTRESIDALLKSVDLVGQMVNAEKNGTPVSADFTAEMLVVLKALAEGKQVTVPTSTPKAAAVATDAAQGWKIFFKPAEDIYTTGNEPLLLISGLAKLGAISVVADGSKIPSFDELDPTKSYTSWNIELSGNVKEEDINEVFEFVSDICEIKLEKIMPTPIATVAAPQVAVTAQTNTATTEAKKAGAAADAAKTTAGAASSIRVDLDKIDRLVNMVGELVITEAMLRAQVRHMPEDKFMGLLRGIDELSQHTRELQEAVMSVRMQPVKSIFSRMPRIVRDTAASLGKDIQLVMLGENTEVDKTVIESLSDPLTHMIRNSIDHGIESPDQRVWNDKPLQGTINLSAYHKGGRIIIEISDDGAGINRIRVLDKAKEKGLVAPDAQLTDLEIDHLIFMPGFSTAEKVTSVSGRGVGMDVVRRNIEGIGGTVSILNNPGKGSTFTVSLPLTLAILDGMIVKVGAENYIIPIISIIETMRPKAEDIKEVVGRGDVINVRGEFIPLVYLNKAFNVLNSETDASKALTVLVECGNEKIGLVVDELVGQQQVVIKSLESNSDPVKGISGATILGDGKVSLILEIEQLRQLTQNPKPSLVAA